MGEGGRTKKKRKEREEEKKNKKKYKVTGMTGDEALVVLVVGM